MCPAEAPAPLKSNDFSIRRLEPEIMDDPGLDETLHHNALAGLARINRVSRSARSLRPVIERAFRRAPRQNAGRPFTVLDLACGGGDVLVDLQRWASSRGLPIVWRGVDRSETALDHARRNRDRAGAEVHFDRLDVLHDELPGGVSLVMNSLFMHHLSQERAVDVLRKMRDSADTVVVNDLRRGRMAYAICRLGTRVLTRSPVVHVDGPLSVRAAWTIDEMRALAEQADMAAARLARVFPWRMLLTWKRPETDSSIAQSGDR